MEINEAETTAPINAIKKKSRVKFFAENIPKQVICVVTGSVISFNPKRRYGFILCDGGESAVFFHSTEIIGQLPNIGDVVHGKLAKGKRDLEIIEVQRTNTQVSNRGQSQNTSWFKRILSVRKKT